MADNFRYSAKGLRINESAIAALMREAITRPEVVSFAAGLTDYDTLPSAAAGDIVGEIVRNEQKWRPALQYGTTRGLAELRRAIMERFLSLEGMRAEKLRFGPDDIIVTGGSQQLLYLLTELLVDPGDVVIVENPSYFVLLELMRGAGAKVVGVEMDEEGMLPDSLVRAIDDAESAGGVKMAYLNTYFQNPTGLTYTMGRKNQIMQTLVRRTQALIVEDGAYRELRYDGVDLPSMKSLDDLNARVAYLGSFSMSFAPGMKTGYGILPAGLLKKAVALKGSHDFGSSNLCQHILCLAHKRGHIESHVSELRRAYRLRRDEMQTALDQHLGELARWRTPRGGFYFWLTIDGEVDTGPQGALFGAAAEEGVLYVPGAYCHTGSATAPRNTLRLSFASVPFEKIRLGVARLAEAVKRARK